MGWSCPALCSTALATKQRGLNVLGKHSSTAGFLLLCWILQLRSEKGDLLLRLATVRTELLVQNAAGPGQRASRTVLGVK